MNNTRYNNLNNTYKKSSQKNVKTTKKPIQKKQSNSKNTKKVANTKTTKKVINKNIQKKPIKKVAKQPIKPIKKVVKQPTKPIVKRKIRYKVLFVFLIILFIVISILYYFITLPIKNIYIKGNSAYSDQEIIELANIENYPSSFLNPSFILEDRLESDLYIKNANVKKLFLKVYIEVEENYPLIYYLPQKITYLSSLDEISEQLNSPILVNEIEVDLLNELLENLNELDKDILNRVSEIQYTPTTDTKRFMLKMNDGNYVYINFNKFTNLNEYLDIVKYLEGKKGILNLDAGNSFEVLE